jgi:hypothetical protein
MLEAFTEEEIEAGKADELVLQLEALRDKAYRAEKLALFVKMCGGDVEKAKAYEEKSWRSMWNDCECEEDEDEEKEQCEGCKDWETMTPADYHAKWGSERPTCECE